MDGRGWVSNRLVTSPLVDNRGHQNGSALGDYKRVSDLGV